MIQSNKAEISIAYEGDALNDGSMDVRELAPALLAIGDLINECNQIINGKNDQIQVKIKSDFKKGSFLIDIEIIRKLLDQITLSATPLLELKDLLELVGFIGGCGLIHLIKQIKGRKIKKAKQIDNGNVQVIFVDESESVTTTMNIYNIYTSVPVQDAIKRVVKPLSQDGIESFYTASAGIRTETINKVDLKYFREPLFELPVQEDELLSKTEYTAAYNVVTAQFEEGYKWRLTNGQDKINVSLSDRSFTSKIDRGEISISKDDIFVVTIRSTQWKKSDNSLRTENEIIEVVKYIKSERTEQLQIALEKTDSE